MIKVLGLALYGPLAASTRYRLGQYVPGLSALGIELELHSLLDDAYLRSRFSGRRASIRGLLLAGWRRLGVLLRLRQYDAVILYGELFPLMPAWLERALLQIPYLYDFDDAFYLKYRTGGLGALRFALGNKSDRVIAGAAAVTAGNATLAEHARRLNPATRLLPTVVDAARYVPTGTAKDDVFTVGWIGSPTTAVYLSELIAPLSRLGESGPVRFVVIGAKAPVVPNVTVVEQAWSEQSEVSLINRFDVGVMPLPDDAWARGKCAFKLIQCMACGVPVVASRVGANIDVVTPGWGVLASNVEEWLSAFQTLRDRPELRRSMGRAGRRRIEESYSLERNLPLLAEAIRNVAQRRR